MEEVLNYIQGLPLWVELLVLANLLGIAWALVRNGGGARLLAAARGKPPPTAKPPPTDTCSNAVLKSQIEGGFKAINARLDTLQKSHQDIVVRLATMTERSEQQERRLQNLENKQ